MPAPAIVIDLVERFHQHLAAYKQNSYNEEQLRIEFLNPMFQALGWDMENSQGYAAAYKEVIHEDAIRVSGVTKAPDYAFRVGGVLTYGAHQARLDQELMLALHRSSAAGGAPIRLPLDAGVA